MIVYPLTIEGTLTRIVEHGQGSDLVVFLHGVGARADRWRANLAALGNGTRRCVALDFPGHGFAMKGAGFNYSVGGYANLIAAFVRQQKADRVRIIATSLGAHVAGMVACRNQGLVSGLLLVGATGLFPIGAEARARIAGRIMDRSREGIAQKLRHVIAEQSLVTDDLVDEEFHINNSEGATESFAALGRYFAESLDDDVIGPDLAAQKALPIATVWGEMDKSVPIEVGFRAADLLGQAPLQIIRGAAHAPYFERPAEFNRVAKDFLRN